jgi:hypothetical protein
LWNRAESVELLLPNVGRQTFRTKKHFSYYKFFVPYDVDHFRLTVASWDRFYESSFRPKTCVTYFYPKKNFPKIEDKHL